MRSIRFRDKEIDFQSACVYCLRWAREKYPFERTFFFGKRSEVVQILAPLCHTHLSLANKISAAQKWSDRLAVLFGVILGGASCTGLLSYWAATEQGTLILNGLLGIITGGSLGFTLWAAIHFWLTPLFASAESKEIINSLRITKYDPNRGFLELSFANDTAAELARRSNLEILDEDLSSYNFYRISAHILSHDIRLNSNLSTTVTLHHPPSLKEAEELLLPIIDLVMARNGGEGCFYEIDCIEVEDLKTKPI